MKLLKALDSLVKELHSVVEGQNNMSKELKEINNKLTGGIGTLRYDDSGVSISSTISTLDLKFDNCVKTYDIADYVDKEIEYKQEYTEYENTKPQIINFVKKYCNPTDKFKELDLIKEIDKLYNIEEKE